VNLAVESVLVVVSPLLGGLPLLPLLLVFPFAPTPAKNEPPPLLPPPHAESSSSAATLTAASGL